MSTNLLCAGGFVTRRRRIAPPRTPVLSNRVPLEHAIRKHLPCSTAAGTSHTRSAAPWRRLPPPTAMLDLRTIAVSRLMLDNFAHIKSYWIMIGAKTAQLGLNFGADDLDGTVVEEEIVHMAGAQTPVGMTRQEIEHLIREAGRDPVERDTLYQPVHRVAAA